MGASEPVHITRRATLQAAGGLAAAAVLGGGLDRAAAAPLAGSPRRSQFKRQGVKDPTGADFNTLYFTLRDAIIGTHRVPNPAAAPPPGVTVESVGGFLTTGRYPLNLAQERSSVVTDPQLSAGFPRTFSDNPLMVTGKLLVPLCVEALLGNSNARSLVRAALTSLQTMFPFTGDFAGYPLRWDPVSSFDWSDIPPVWGDVGRYSRNFMIDDSGRYQLSAPVHDWRGARRLSQDEFTQLTDQQRQQWQARNKGTYHGRFRQCEPSSDEMVGLITGLFFVTQTLPGPLARQATAMLDNIAKYLSRHAYFHVRPNGGFASRGPVLGSLAGEYAYQRVFARTLGNPHPAIGGMPDVLQQAGLWLSLEKAWTLGAAVGIAAEVLLPVLAPILDSVLGPAGTAAGLTASALLAFLLANGVTGADLGGFYALSQNQIIFDCETSIAGDDINEAYPNEIVLGALMRPLDAGRRLGWYMNQYGSRAASGWSVGFLPYFALTGLDDSDTTVADNYMGLYDHRAKYNVGWLQWPDYTDAPRGMFWTAPALLLASSQADRDPGRVQKYEQELVTGLSAAHGWFAQQGSTIQPGGATVPGALPVRAIQQAGPYGAEDINEALDYLWAVSLAWLYRHRRTARHLAVRPDLPPLPTPAQLSEKSFTPRPKPPAPSPRLPIPLGPQAMFSTVTVQVGPTSGRVDTGLDISSYDDVEIIAAGSINSGQLFSGSSHADGWDLIADTPGYLMLGNDSRRYALIGSIDEYGSWFPVGQHFPRRRYHYEHAGRLYLAVNTDTPHAGSGAFSVTVNRWSFWPRFASDLIWTLQWNDGWTRAQWESLAAAANANGARVTALAAAPVQGDVLFIAAEERGTGGRPGLLQIRASQAGFQDPVPMPTSTVLTNNVVSAAGTGSTGGPQVILALDDGRVLHAVMNPNGEWTGFGDVKRQIGNIGTVTSVAAATPPDSPDAAHFVLATSDGQLWHTIRSVAGPWIHAENITAQLGAHGPVTAIAATGVTTEYGSVQIMYSTTDGSLWHSTRAFAGNWAPAGNVKDQIGDPGTVVSISSTSREPGFSEWGLVTTAGKLLQCMRRLDTTWSAVPQDLFVYINPAQPVIPMVVAAASPAATAAQYLIAVWNPAAAGPR